MLIALYRLSNLLLRLRVPVAPRCIYAFNRLVFGVVLPPSAVLGKGVQLAYSGLGVVIHARARVGARVHVGTKVTIGGRSGFFEVPIIGDDVLIGSGANILGPITIGAGAKIGANAVVLIDVPPGATAVGNPAKIIVKT